MAYTVAVAVAQAAGTVAQSTVAQSSVPQTAVSVGRNRITWNKNIFWLSTFVMTITHELCAI